jgi:hypothetical protein
VLNGHLVCNSLTDGGREAEIPLLDKLQAGADVAPFLRPGYGDTRMLQCACLTCANPSCGHYFGLLYNQYKQMASSQHVQRTLASLGSGELEMRVNLDCRCCGVSRAVGKRSFADLAKL